MNNFPTHLLSVTAKDLLSNKKMLDNYNLYKKRYSYRSLKSSFFDPAALEQLDEKITQFLTSRNKHFTEAFRGINMQEQHILAATLLLVPEEEYKVTCEEIAESLLLFDGRTVEKEVVRALLHLLSRTPSRCLKKDESPLTFHELITALRCRNAKSLV